MSRPAHEGVALAMLRADGWTESQLDAALGIPPIPSRLAAVLGVHVVLLTHGDRFAFERATGGKSYPPPPNLRGWDGLC